MLLAGVQAEGVAEKLGKQARQHVQKRFSRQAFGDKLNTILLELSGPKRKKKS